MIFGCSSICSLIAFILQIIQKAIAFQIIYRTLQCKNLMIFTIKRLQKNMINMRISVYQKEKNRKRAMGAGRPFKLDVKNRFLMLLVYYRLYITYTLAGFLFDLDQSNICRDIQKIERLIRKCIPIPQKIYKLQKD